ncbi:MAG TPA: dihydrofolate reductase family protein [Gemmatimonadaceae bacterium]|jgi:dihydrofolate reductase|nr:dihydrofolate reductase family protein [Gemmatimonadaceae bacterium]
MTRRIRYQVAASLDGYIAGPDGEFDWIPHDPEVDFEKLFEQFDTFLMGRGTLETMVKQQGSGAIPGKRVIVFSRTLRQENHPEVTIVSEPSERFLNALRNEPGRDIWLFGGGSLFRSLLEVRGVDTIEVAIMPILLGGGIPILPAPAPRAKLKLRSHEVSKIGRVSVEYDIEYGGQ